MNYGEDMIDPTNRRGRQCATAVQQIFLTSLIITEKVNPHCVHFNSTR